MSGKSNPKDYFIALQVEDLIEALCKGVEKFLRELEADQKRAEAAYAKAGDLFTHLPAEKGAGLLRMAEEIFAKNRK